MLLMKYFLWCGNNLSDKIQAKGNASTFSKNGAVITYKKIPICESSIECLTESIGVIIIGFLLYEMFPLTVEMFCSFILVVRRI